MIKLNKKEVLKIRTKELDLLKRNEIITTVILTIMIIAILLFVVISDNKVEEVIAENIENEILNIQDEEEEYIDISQLEENVIDEEENTVEQNIDKNNNTINNQTPSKEKEEGNPYYIKVNYGAQVVTIYKKDSQGNYTNAIKAMVCSTGEYTPTSGVYKIKERWKWLGLEGDVYGQYATQIVGNILFHSVP